MKRLLDYFFPPLHDKHPGMILLNARDHLGHRIYSAGCFKANGMVHPEDREAMAILTKALKECL